MIGDFMFVVTTREVKAGCEITTSYADFRQSYTERSEGFRRWRGPNDGFECACERCSYVRSHPDYRELEQAVYRAMYFTEELVKEQGLSRAEAAAKALESSGVVRANVLALRKLPVMHQIPLVNYLRLTCMIHRQQKDVRAEYEADLEAYEIEATFFGDRIQCSAWAKEDFRSNIRLASLAHAGVGDAQAHIRRARARNYQHLPVETWIAKTGWTETDLMRQALA
jgi:hypothetical protein